MMHRSLRLSAFLIGLVAGGLAVLFAFDNPSHTAVAIGSWRLPEVPLWTLAVVPLVVGVTVGYLYHLPARLHHFNEHMRHRGLVHDLRRENAELSRSLDRLLAMPNDDTPALAAAAAARDVTPGPMLGQPAAPRVALAEPLQTPGAVPTPSGEPAPRVRRGERRPGPLAATMSEAVAAAAAAMPSDPPPHPARAPRRGAAVQAGDPTAG